MAEVGLNDPDIAYRDLATYVFSWHKQSVLTTAVSFYSGRTPLKKFAIPSDIANQIAIISSQTVSGHISGEVLMITGGMEG